MIQWQWSEHVYKHSPDGVNCEEYKGELYNRPVLKSARHTYNGLASLNCNGKDSGM